MAMVCLKQELFIAMVRLKKAVVYSHGPSETLFIAMVRLKHCL